MPPGLPIAATEDKRREPPAEGSPSGVPPVAPPVLTPPVLMTAPTGASWEAVRVILDRGLLTPQLRVAALEGKVILAVLVRMDGTVAQAKVEVSSGSDLLDRLAVKAAEGWYFRPATRDGVATDSWAIIPVRFVVP